jgi:hypothetical protein
MGNEQQQGQRPNQHSEKTARGIVARGRSVDVPDSSVRQTIGYNAEGKPVTKAAIRTYLPGQELQLPEREILSLRERGFLLDPDQSVPELAEGPRFTENGPHASAA